MQVFAFNRSIVTLFIAVFLLGIAACVDKKFDSPPAGGTDPGITPNTSIADLRAMHSIGEYEEIVDDLIIEGIVISSDLAGNFFRQLVLQDATGGIEMRIDMTNLDNVYPPGRQVFVKLKGLWLGDYNALIQLGASVVEGNNGQELSRIPEVLLEDYLFKGTYDNEVIPKVKEIDEITSADVSTLVILNGTQFTDSDAGETYADAVNQQTVNRTIVNCDKDEVLLRTSGYSAFAADTTPTGNGSITAVVGIFQSTIQLAIRSQSDVVMEDARCQIGGGNEIDIRSVRDAFDNGQGVAPDGFIKGVVISDRSTNNIVDFTLVMQDATAGITIAFEDGHSFDLGDEIIVDISGLGLVDYNGLLQVSNTPSSNVSWAGDGTLPAPRVATVEEVLQNASIWQSSRVLINDVSMSGQSSFSGNVTCSDATGAMVMYTRSQASFSSSPLPADKVNLTAIVSMFNSPQLFINSLDDVDGDISGGGDINQSFDAFEDNEDINIPGWANVAVKGSRIWRCKVFDDRHYAQATAFQDTEAEADSWLVTTKIELDVPKEIVFETAQAYWSHAGFSVLASSDYSGDVTAATWVDLGAQLADQSNADHEWVGSGTIDLTDFGDQVYIAYRYVGSGPNGESGTFRVDDIVVQLK